MRTILFILSAWLLCPFLLPAQDSRDMPTRTPEQEAARQTEMLRQARFTRIAVFGDGRLEAPREGEQRIYMKARKGRIL